MITVAGIKRAMPRWFGVRHIRFGISVIRNEFRYQWYRYTQSGDKESEIAFWVKFGNAVDRNQRILDGLE